jgi:hypothetical protein
MEDTKIKDEDLALLNSLMGKYIVYPPSVSHRSELPVIVVDTLEESKALHDMLEELSFVVPEDGSQVRWAFWADAVIDIIASWAPRHDHLGLIDRLREIVNEGGVVREEVGRTPPGTLPE